MAAHGMTFGRPIYGESAFVAKVAMRSAMTVANALRNNPLLDVAGVNTIMKLYDDPSYVPNDPLAQPTNPNGQRHLRADKINAFTAWNYSRGLGAVSLIAVADTGIDVHGQDGIGHEDFLSKYFPKNWQDFVGEPGNGDLVGHGTHVGGIYTAATDNGLGGAGTAFSAWPMSLKVGTPVWGCGDILLDKAVDGINWAYEHGASVINMSWGCGRSFYNGCNPTDKVMQLLKVAVDKAYGRGVTLVAAAGNEGWRPPPYDQHPNYPAAFGQVHDDENYGWSYNEHLVLAVSGTIDNMRDPISSYGDWIDFAAPFEEDNTEEILSTLPTEAGCIIGDVNYGRLHGTSMASPQVAGLALLLTSQGYTKEQVYSLIKGEATDLPPAGYDIQTGWGRINMGSSVIKALRTLNTVDMVVVPNAGQRGVQQFNFMGSGFTPGATLRTCYTPAGQQPQCTRGPVLELGVAGFGITPSLVNPEGVWTVQMCQEGSPEHCTPVKSFDVYP